MKNNGVVIFIISLVVIICIALFFVFYLREFEFSVLLDKNKINSYSSDIKIYINDDEGSYINIFSRQNRDEIIKCLGNIKIKRCLFNNEEYNGGLLININKDENKIALKNL